MGSTGNSSAPCNKDNESLAVQLVDFPFLQYARELRPKWPYKTPHPHPNLANKRASVTEKSHLDTYTAGLTASKMLRPCLGELLGAFASPRSSKSQKLPQMGSAIPKNKSWKNSFYTINRKAHPVQLPELLRANPSLILSHPFSSTRCSTLSPTGRAQALHRPMSPRPPTPPSAGAPPRHHLWHNRCSGLARASSLGRSKAKLCGCSLRPAGASSLRWRGRR